MALWRCRNCGTKFAVGLAYCPQCTSTNVEADTEMPKITRHGGPSFAGEVQGQAVDNDLAALPPVADEQPEKVDYSQLRKAELQGIATERGLPTTGTVPDLIARLEQDDERKAEEGDGEPEPDTGGTEGDGDGDGSGDDVIIQPDSSVLGVSSTGPDETNKED